MGMPTGIGIVDTMIGFPHEGSGQYDFIRRQTKDRSSREEMEFPVEYMFKNVPKDLPTSDPVSVTLHEMDRFGIEIGVIGVADETSRAALKRHPDRFVPMGNVDDPNDVGGTVRKLRQDYEEFGIRATGAFPAGTFPQVAIDDPKMYPVYQTCVDLDIPIFCCAGIPGPRLKFAPQEVARIDVRAQVLPAGDHRLRQHARRGQGPLCRLLPHGAEPGAHFLRHAAGAVQG